MSYAKERFVLLCRDILENGQRIEKELHWNKGMAGLDWPFHGGGFLGINRLVKGGVLRGQRVRMSDPLYGLLHEKARALKGGTYVFVAVDEARLRRIIEVPAEAEPFFMVSTRVEITLEQAIRRIQDELRSCAVSGRPHLLLSVYRRLLDSADKAE